MKIYLLAYLACMAFKGVPIKGQEAIHIDVPIVEVPVKVIEQPVSTEEEIIEVSDENDIDVARMIGDLFEFHFETDNKGIRKKRPTKRDTQDVGDLSEVSDISDVRINENMIPVNDLDLVFKYNNFMDAFFTRLSNSMLLNHDPMRLVIRQSGQIDAEDFPRKNKGNRNKGFGKRNNSPKNERKNRNRRPKDLSVNIEENPSENDEVKLDRIRREVNSKTEENLDEYDEEYYDDDESIHDNELEGRALDNEDFLYDDEYYDDFEDGEYDGVEKVESPREARKLAPKDKKESKETGRNVDLVEGRQRRRGVRRRRRRKGGNKQQCGKFCQRRRRRLRRRRLRNRRRGKRAIETPSAVISGISNMRRVGNVRILEGRDSQDIGVNFDIGPIILRAQRSYVSGSKTDIRQAQATASRVGGEVVVNVNRDGTARVKKLQLLRPDSIKVSGTLRKKASLSSDLAMQGLVRRTRPVVAKKMRQAAAKIFRSMNTPDINVNINN